MADDNEARKKAALDELSALCADMAADLEEVGNVLGNGGEGKTTFNIAAPAPKTQPTQREAARGHLKNDIFDGNAELDFNFDDVVIGGSANPDDLDALMATFDTDDQLPGGSRNLNDLEMESFDSLGFDPEITKTLTQEEQKVNMSDHEYAGILMALEMKIRRDAEELSGKMLLGPDLAPALAEFLRPVNQVRDIIDPTHTNESEVLQEASMELVEVAKGVVVTPNAQLTEKITEIVELVSGVVALVATRMRPALSETTASVYVLQVKAIVDCANELVRQTTREEATAFLLQMVSLTNQFNSLIGSTYQPHVDTVTTAIKDVASYAHATLFPSDEFKTKVFGYVNLLQVTMKDILRDVQPDS